MNDEPFPFSATYSDAPAAAAFKIAIAWLKSLTYLFEKIALFAATTYVSC